MKKQLQALSIIFLSVTCFAQNDEEKFNISSECLYSSNGVKYKKLQCNIERLDVGANYYSDQLTMNKIPFIVTVGNITPSFSGEEYATIESKSIKKEEVTYLLLDELSNKTIDNAAWQCFQRKTNSETFCEPTIDRLFSGNGVSQTETKYPSGAYKVGSDIPAGEYKVVATSDDKTGNLFVSSTANYRESVVHSEIFQNQTYVTVKDGQYLRVNFGEFSLVK